MEEPQKGEIYKHCKGGEYEIVGVALDSSDDALKKLVIYKQLYERENFPQGTVWARSLEDFSGQKEIDGQSVKRFELVETK
jgi:hypothetical protein